MQLVNGGILRAMGYQNAGSIIQGVALFVVMNPLAYILAFKYEYGFIGIWMAVPVGSFLMMTGFFYILYQADWETIAIKASTDDVINETEDIYLISPQSNMYQKLL